MNRSCSSAFRCLIFGIVISGSGGGCVGEPLQRYETSLYRVLKEPSPEHTAAHAEMLEGLIREAEAGGKKPPPGICVEYALYLDRTDQGGRAAEFLEKEAQYYGESTTFVGVVKRLLAGESQLIESSDEK